jgi:hypothetical protein
VLCRKNAEIVQKKTLSAFVLRIEFIVVADILFVRPLVDVVVS